MIAATFLRLSWILTLSFFEPLAFQNIPSCKSLSLKSSKSRKETFLFPFFFLNLTHDGWQITVIVCSLSWNSSLVEIQTAKGINLTFHLRSPWTFLSYGSFPTHYRWTRSRKYLLQQFLRLLFDTQYNRNHQWLQWQLLIRIPSRLDPQDSQGPQLTDNDVQHHGGHLQRGRGARVIAGVSHRDRRNGKCADGGVRRLPVDCQLVVTVRAHHPTVTLQGIRRSGVRKVVEGSDAWRDVTCDVAGVMWVKPGDVRMVGMAGCELRCGKRDA